MVKFLQKVKLQLHAAFFIYLITFNKFGYGGKTEI
jgi:hypothetical protein